jgi:hypothetical protein
MGVPGDQVDLLRAGDVYDLIYHRVGNRYPEKPFCRLSILLLNHQLEIVRSGGAVCLLLLGAKDDVLT